MTFLPLRNRNAREFLVVILAATILAFFCFEFVSRSKAAAVRDSHANTSEANSTRLANSLAAPIAGSTYTWTPALGSTDWQLPTNWSPPRPTAASATTTDILIFDGNVTPSPIVTDVPTQTIATLSLVNNNIAVTLNASTLGAQTLTISGGALSVAAGTSLTVAGSNALTISVAPGSTGTVSGQIILQDAAHKVQANDANGINFQSGSIFTTSTGFTGNPFGTGTDGSVVFASGASSFFNAGSDPFGGSGHSIATFNLGSSQTLNAATAFSSDGRVYGNLTLDGSQNYSGSGANPLTIFNTLNIASGSTLTLSNSSGGDLNLLGDITINGTLDQNGRVVMFQGGAATQNINSTATFDDVIVSKIGGSVTLAAAVTINGALQFNGTSSAVDVIEFNSKALNLNGTIGGTSASTSNGFKGDVAGATLNIGGTGALGTLRFVSGAQTLKSLTVNRTSSGSVTLGSNLTIGNASIGSLTLTAGVIDVGSNTLSLASFPSISRTNGYVIGNLQKTFSGPGLFIFTVGTANGYSPLDADVTAGTGNSLTVKAVQGKHPSITEPNALLRYWTISNSGSVTANLTFHYSASSPNDIVGTEANYKIFKYNAGFAQFTPNTVGVNGPQDHFATLNGVSSFSDWTLADPTLTVNTTDDVDNGACLTSHCSLREAINAANFSGDPNTINFSIPGGDSGCSGGVCTISLATALPSLTTDMTITGSGANVLTVMRSTVGGTPDFRILTVDGSGTTVSILGLTIANGRAFNGAGMYNSSTLTVTGCNFFGSVTPAGGVGAAIINFGASLTLNDCHVGGTSAGQPNTSLGAGAVWNSSGALVMNGGSVVGNHGIGIVTIGTLTMNGVAVTDNVNNTSGAGLYVFGTTDITDCLIANNSSPNSGGGIFDQGATVSVANSTVSGNVADDGGGVSNRSGTVDLTNVTITNNRGGGIDQVTGVMSLRNSIVAGNFQASPSTVAGDISGTVAVGSSFNNLIGTGGSGGLSNANGNLVGVSDPRLGPLANNGGPTKTHALLAGSPALDAGSNALATSAGLNADQRGNGFNRIRDAADADTVATVDIGAFEAQAAVEDITDKSIAEDTPLSFSFNVGDANAITNVTASSSNPTLVPNAPANISVSGSGSTRMLNITTAGNQFGSSTITVSVTSGSETMSDTFVLTVTPVADPPSVTNATTNEDTQTSSGLVISRNTADGGEVTNFRISGITNGTLFKNNGTTQINNGDFITFAEGNAGLKFTPAANLFSPTTVFSFDVRGATDGSGSGLSPATTATITVNPVADAPSVTPATTIVNTQTASGLVISRNSVDGTEVTHFKITNITNGTLFKNDGTTQINNNTFITFAEGNAGLRFTPAHNLASPSSTFSFQVQGATSSGGAGLGSAATASITVNCGPTVVTNSKDSGAGSLRNAINTACPGDTITFNIPTSDPGFSAGVYTVTLSSGELLIDKNLTITGLGANVLTVTRSAVGGTPNFRIFNINFATTVTITDLTISNGNLIAFGSSGGGVLNNSTLTLANCNIYGNSVAGVNGSGGGIYSFGPSLTLTNCNIGGVGAGLPNGGEGVASVGTLVIAGGSISGNTRSGIAFDGTSATLNGVSITSNTSTNGHSGAGFGGTSAIVKIINCLIANNIGQDGGGIFIAGSTALVANTTISGNTARGFGGGIDILNATNVTLTNVTITNNRAANGGGISASGAVLLNNTIVAGNFRVQGPNTTSEDIQNLVSSSSSFNLIGNCNGCGLSNGVNNNQVGVANPSIGALANNGGPTQTHLLLPGSPAINAGSNALLPADTFDLDGDGNVAEALPVDQRGAGFNRVVSTTVDIGAVEVNYSMTATAGTPQSATIGSNFATQLQATVKESGVNQSGVTVTFTAPASGASGTFPGNVTTANATTDASGVASAPVFTANGTAGGPYNVVAGLAGGSPTANFSLTNTKAATATTVLSSVNPSDLGQNVSFTATVTGGSGTPTGVIQFTDGASNLGASVSCVGSGASTCTAHVSTAILTSGTHSISATYSGDSIYLGSTGTLSGGQFVTTQPALQLILDESGPDANQVAAFDSLLFVRDPFQVQSIATWLDLGSDRNTRVIIFAANLQLNQGEPASVVSVSLVDGNNQTFSLRAEDVRVVPNSSFTQVRFRLPDNLAGGVCMVTINAHGQTSNTGTIRIVLP